MNARQQAEKILRLAHYHVPKPKSASKCPVCGMKIRGPGHEAGEHHQRALRK